MTEQEILEKINKINLIEEELGIPLEVLVKALKDGIWYKNEHIPVEFILLNFKRQLFEICLDYKGIPGFMDIPLCDYQITWALTREEL